MLPLPTSSRYQKVRTTQQWFIPSKVGTFLSTGLVPDTLFLISKEQGKEPTPNHQFIGEFLKPQNWQSFCSKFPLINCNGISLNLEKFQKLKTRGY